MLKKSFSKLLAVILLTVVLCGCNNDAKKTVTLKEDEVYNVTFWYSMGGLGQQALQHMVSEFNNSHSNIHVDAQFQGEYADTFNKFKSSLIGGQLPDIIQIGDENTRWMADCNEVIPMQNLIDSESYDISALEENILAYYTIEDKLYSMPFNCSTPILYYNKDLFAEAGLDPEKPPENLNEVIEYGKKLVKKDENDKIIQSAISVNDAELNGWFFSEWLCMEGLPYTNHNNGRTSRATKVEYDKNGGGVKILKKLKEVQDSGITSSAKTLSDIFGLFASGQTAMMLASNAGVSFALSAAEGNFELGTGYFPSVSQKTKGGVSVGGASLWIIDNDDVAKQKASFEFIKFMASAAQQVYWNGQTGYFPITTEAYDIPEMQQRLEEFPQYKTAIDQMHESNPESQGVLISVFPELGEHYHEALTKVLSGEMTPEEAIAMAAGKANQTIEDYNRSNPQ